MTSISSTFTSDMATKLVTEVEVKSSADKFFGAITDSTALFPKIFPEQYKSIEIVEGDGKTVGSTRLVTYAEGMPLVKTAKEKIEIADETNKTVAYSVIDGEILDYYKPFKVTVTVVPKGDGAAVKWSLEYDKVNDEVPGPDIVQETAAQTFSDLDAYLLKN